jgi:hypothetical protein
MKHCMFARHTKTHASTNLVYMHARMKDLTLRISTASRRKQAVAAECVLQLHDQFSNASVAAA